MKDDKLLLFKVMVWNIYNHHKTILAKAEIFQNYPTLDEKKLY